MAARRIACFAAMVATAAPTPTIGAVTLATVTADWTLTTAVLRPTPTVPPITLPTPEPTPPPIEAERQITPVFFDLVFMVGAGSTLVGPEVVEIGTDVTEVATWLVAVVVVLLAGFVACDDTE